MSSKTCLPIQEPRRVRELHEFRKAIDESARVGCRSISGGKAEGMDRKRVRAKVSCISIT